MPVAAAPTSLLSAVAATLGATTPHRQWAQCLMDTRQDEMPPVPLQRPITTIITTCTVHLHSKFPPPLRASDVSDDIISIISSNTVPKTSLGEFLIETKILFNC